MGIHVPHHLLHGVETAGIVVAVVSTVTATVGELLAVRAMVAQEKQRLQEEVDANTVKLMNALEDLDAEKPSGHWVDGNGTGNLHTTRVTDKLSHSK